MNTVHNTYVERNHYGQYVWRCSCSAYGAYFSRDAAGIAATDHERMHNIREEDTKSKIVATFPKVRRYYKVYDNDGVRSHRTDKEEAIEKARVINNNGEVKTWVVEYEEEEV